MRYGLTMVCVCLAVASVAQAVWVENQAAASMTRTNAVMVGNILDTNGVTGALQLHLLYAKSDYSTNFAAWTYTNTFAVAATGAVSTNVVGLLPATRYYYNWVIASTNARFWPTGSSNVVTLSGAPTGAAPVVVYHPVMEGTNGTLAASTNFFGMNTGRLSQAQVVLVPDLAAYVANAVTNVSTNGLASTAFVGAAVTNLLPSITNGLASTLYVAAAVTNNTMTTNGLASTIYVANAVTNVSTNGLASTAFVAAAVTNQLPSITNGLASTIYVAAAVTNQLPSITNGLASTLYVAAMTNDFVKTNHVGNTTQSGSSAQGDTTTASGAHSHAEGLLTTASGQGAHAEGWGTIAAGVSSHAEGYYSAASGNFSHAEGKFCIANAAVTHAAGVSAVASNVNSWVWQGSITGTEPPYFDNGYGTFNINPVGGLAGFYIGETNLQTLLDAKINTNNVAPGGYYAATNNSGSVEFVAFTPGSGTGAGSAFTNIIGGQAYTNTGFTMAGGSNVTTRYEGGTNFFDIDASNIVATATNLASIAAAAKFLTNGQHNARFGTNLNVSSLVVTGSVSMLNGKYQLYTFAGRQKTFHLFTWNKFYNSYTTSEALDFDLYDAHDYDNYSAANILINRTGAGQVKAWGTSASSYHVRIRVFDDASLLGATTNVYVYAQTDNYCDLFTLNVKYNRTSSPMIATNAGSDNTYIPTGGTLIFDSTSNVNVWTEGTVSHPQTLSFKGGNVAIGTNAPAAKLDVNGGAIIRGASTNLGTLTIYDGTATNHAASLGQVVNSTNLLYIALTNYMDVAGYTNRTVTNLLASLTALSTSNEATRVASTNASDIMAGIRFTNWPYFRVDMITSSNYPASGGVRKVPFDTLREENGASSGFGWNSTTRSYRPPIAGRYRFSTFVYASFPAGNPANYQSVYIETNITPTSASQKVNYYYPSSVTPAGIGGVTRTFTLTTTDVVSVFYYMNTVSGTISAASAPQSTTFEGELIAPSNP
jgi:hypothetical protein